MSDTICEVRAFSERDVDVWLAEELRVNPEFAKWFACKAGSSDEYMIFSAVSVRISVNSEYGETDVEALFESQSGTKIAILIENKINHSVSADQLSRYIDRGEDGRRRHYWDQFVVVVFAPQATISRHAAVIGRTPTVSFESAAAFLKQHAVDDRSIYRYQFLELASLKPVLDKQGADRVRIDFWRRFYEIAESSFPEYFQLNQRNFPKTAFISVNPKESPKYLRVDLKGHMGEVDLTFSRLPPGRLINFLEEKKPSQTRIEFNRGSIALRISGLPKFRVSDGFERSKDAVLESLTATRFLAEFWKSHQAFLSELDSGSTDSLRE